jgi:predicted Zn-dependent peptidase
MKKSLLTAAKLLLFCAISWSGISNVKLENGLTLAVEENPNSETVSVLVYVKGGKNCEKKVGLASLLARLLMDDNKRYKAKEMSRLVEATGGFFGAYASCDSVRLYGYVPVKDWNILLDILKEMLIHPLLKNSDVSREKAFMLNSLEGRYDDPEQRIYDEVHRVIFKDHPRGRLHIDHKDQIKAIDAPSVRNFHKKYFKTGNTIIVVVGKIVVSDVVMQVQDCFGGMPEGSCSFPVNSYSLLEKDFRSKINVRTTEAQFCMATTFSRLSLKEETTLSVISGILGDSRARLFNEIREKRGYAYWVSSYGDSKKEGNIWRIITGVKKRRFDEVEEIVRRELNRLVKKHVSLEELKTAKMRLITEIHMYKNTNNYRARYIAERLLEGEEPLTIKERVNLIKSVKAKDIRFLANKLFGKRKFAIVALY